MRTTLIATVSFGCLALQTTAIGQTCNAGQTPSTPTSEFVVHGNGTVTHGKTGLMWKVCSEGQTWSDSGSGPTCADVTTTHQFAAALTLAEAHTFAGYRDWRLPSFQELQSIVETCRVPPIRNTINNEVFPATPSLLAWSGSPFADGSANAFGVLFSTGASGGVDTGASLRVRLVRGGQPFRTLGYLANGYCGVAADAPRATVPTTGLCAEATVPTVNSSASSFTWQCAGSANTTNNQTGATVNCSTPRHYIVSVLPNPPTAMGRLECMATTGSSLGLSTTIAHNETASCFATPNAGVRTRSISGCGGTATGSGVDRYVSGAITADCTVAASFEFTSLVSAPGICGVAVNAFSVSAPTANLCASVGGNSAATKVGINWNWTCLGTNGGTHASCSAPATACTMDIDGDGVVNSTIDALIHARIAVGMVGPDVLNGLNIPLNAARRDWTAIRDHLVDRCGMVLP